jgi:hypothetical protein
MNKENANIKNETKTPNSKMSSILYCELIFKNEFAFLNSRGITREECSFLIRRIIAESPHGNNAIGCS